MNYIIHNSVVKDRRLLLDINNILTLINSNLIYIIVYLFFFLIFNLLIYFVDVNLLILDLLLISFCNL